MLAAVGVTCRDRGRGFLARWMPALVAGRSKAFLPLLAVSLTMTAGGHCTSSSSSSSDCDSMGDDAEEERIAMSSSLAIFLTSTAASFFATSCTTSFAATIALAWRSGISVVAGQSTSLRMRSKLSLTTAFGCACICTARLRKSCGQLLLWPRAAARCGEARRSLARGSTRDSRELQRVMAAEIV